MTDEFHAQMACNATSDFIILPRIIYAKCGQIIYGLLLKTVAFLITKSNYLCLICGKYIFDITNTTVRPVCLHDVFLTI